MPFSPATVWNRVYSDFLMPSRLHAFRRLLELAQAAGYEITSIERFWLRIVGGTVDPGGKYLILRHDVDTDPGTAARMWRIERALGVHGSYYFRLSTLDIPLMERIEAAGGSASYHYEEVATLAKRLRLRSPEAVLRHLTEAGDAFVANLQRLRRTTGLPMAAVASHGDFVNRRLGLPNWIILRDEALRRAAGVDLEVYDEAFMGRVTSRHADTGYPRYWTPAPPGRALRGGEPVVYLLVHPRHWGASPLVNARDDARRAWEAILYGLPGPRVPID